MKSFLIIAIFLLMLMFTNSNGQSHDSLCQVTKPVRLKPTEIISRAVKKVAPTFPKGCRCKGRITAFLVVNTEGKVESVTTSKGHPLLRVAVTNALREWDFLPVERKGERSCFSGYIRFSF